MRSFQCVYSPSIFNMCLTDCPMSTYTPFFAATDLALTSSHCSRHYIQRLRQQCKSVATNTAHSPFNVASDRGVCWAWLFIPYASTPSSMTWNVAFRDSRPVSVVACADDVMVFLTSASDIPSVEDAIYQFEKASGARLNPHKSRALAIGKWSTPDNPLGIAYHPHTRILGFQFWSTICQSVSATWSYITGQVRFLGKDSYQRDLCLAHRITYVHFYLLARLWYVAQVLPAPRICTQQITSAMTFFIWKGATFRVPISMLQSQSGRWVGITGHLRQMQGTAAK